MGHRLIKVIYYNRIPKVLKLLPKKITYRVYRFNKPLSLKRNPLGPRAGPSGKARLVGIRIGIIRF